MNSFTKTSRKWFNRGKSFLKRRTPLGKNVWNLDRFERTLRVFLLYFSFSNIFLSIFNFIIFSSEINFRKIKFLCHYESLIRWKKFLEDFSPWSFGEREFQIGLFSLCCMGGFFHFYKFQKSCVSITFVKFRSIFCEKKSWTDWGRNLFFKIIQLPSFENAPFWQFTKNPDSIFSPWKPLICF